MVTLFKNSSSLISLYSPNPLFSYSTLALFLLNSSILSTFILLKIFSASSSKNSSSSSSDSFLKGFYALMTYPLGFYYCCYAPIYIFSLSLIAFSITTSVSMLPIKPLLIFNLVCALFSFFFYFFPTL